VDAGKEEKMTESVDEEEVAVVEEIEDAAVVVVEIEDAVVAVEEIEEEEEEAISRGRRHSNGTSKNHVKKLVLTNPRRENERKEQRLRIRVKLRFKAACIPSSLKLW
jgi:hypothetical protein